MAHAEDVAKRIDLQDLPPSIGEGSALYDGNLDLIKDIEVVVSVVVGRARLSVERLFALKDGATLALDAAADDPVELHLDGKLIGRGELVAVGDNFGIRITQVGNAAA